MATTGVTGGRWRADVSPTGSVEPWDGSPALSWHVAADDRWHDPAVDPGVRQTRVDGTAVFETRLRVPRGDAVQRVWSVADRGGITLVEVSNESPLPIACAFSRSDLLTTRPPTDVPIQGIDLIAGSIVLPIGHRSSIVVGLAHATPAAGPLPGGLPPADAVARGWVARTDSASRLVLPDASAIEAVRAARCEMALAGPPAAQDDPSRFLLGLGELVRMGEIDSKGCAELTLDVAAAVAAVAACEDRLAPCAFAAAGVVLATAGERRAVADLARIAVRSPDTIDEPVDADDIVNVAAVERRVASGPRLFPGGIPAAWLGQSVEAHNLVAGPSSRLSVAVRWHGPNAAVLWEVEGDPVTLTASVGTSPWTTAERRGEALWQLAPAG